MQWLIKCQRADGGWGEDEDTYASAPPGQYKESTPSQTAWALLGLMAAGEVSHPAVSRGIASAMIRAMTSDGMIGRVPSDAASDGSTAWRGGAGEKSGPRGDGSASATAAPL